MDVSVLATKTSKPACWDAPEVFSDLALDYDARDEDFAHLDAAGHAAAAEARRKAEEAAVNVCYDCPLMLACEEMDAKAMAKPGAVFVHGVIGGLTEDERLARLGRRRSSTVAPTNPQIAPGDRGPRKQVDDALVARMTIAGKTGDQIAHDLQCSVRTVTRARKRMSAVLAGATEVATTPAASPAVTAFAATSGPTGPTRPAAPKSLAADVTNKMTDACSTSRISTRTTTRPTTPTTPRAQSSSKATRPTVMSVQASNETRSPMLNGRKISPAMAAVYDHLFRHGEASFEDLKNLAAQHIDAAEAMEWWLTRNSTMDNGVRVIRPRKATMTETERIREGALLKAHNAIDAAVRAGRYLSKTDATVTLLPAAATAWGQRLAAA